MNLTITSEAVADLDTYNGGTTVNNPDWGGSVLDQGSTTYTEAVAEYNVPSIYNTTYSITSMWAGIDGWGTADVIQDGVEIDYNGGPVTYAWIEYYPNNAIREFNVNQGDLMYLWCWASDSAGNQNASGGYATYGVDDLTSGNGTGTIILKAPNSSFQGKTAELIIERKKSCNTCSHYPLTDYGFATMLGGAGDSNGNGHDVSTDSFLNVDTQDGTGTIVQFTGAPAGGNADETAWEWAAPGASD